MKYKGIELIEYSKGKFYFECDELAATHDRRGPVEAKRDAFIQRHGLQESRCKMYPRWLALLPRGMRHCGLRSRWEGPAEAHKVMSGSHVVDHDQLFLKNGAYVYCTMPYDLELRRYQAVERYWRGLGLFVGISIADAWHFPGRTPLVVISQVPITLTGFQPDSLSMGGMMQSLRKSFA